MDLVDYDWLPKFPHLFGLWERLWTLDLASMSSALLLSSVASGISLVVSRSCIDGPLAHVDASAMPEQDPIV